MTGFGQAAAALAADGYAVFPLAVRGKVPMIAKADGGRGCHDATRHADQVAAWWQRWPDANIGVATGLAHGLYVVDVDGPAAARAWATLAAEQPQELPTSIVATGRGWHLWYRLTGPVDLPSTAGRIAPGIDTRGRGGYVIAPPSIHPSGTPYRWARQAPLADLPEWARGLVAPPPDPAPGPRAPVRIADQTGDVGLRILAEECDRVAAAGAGTRNMTAFTRAAAIGNLVAGGDITLPLAAEALIDAAVAAGLPRPEAVAAVTNGLAHGISTPRTYRTSA
jgi:Bifunctional DNA primase/polymerase, N-terminal